VSELSARLLPVGSRVERYLPSVTAAASAATIVAVEIVVRRGDLRSAWVQLWCTIMIAIVVQAIPFLLLGVLISATVSIFVPLTELAGRLPRRGLVATPMAALAGVALPGCECGSVAVAVRLMRANVPTGVALAFQLAAPAVNPVVIVATVIAYPGRPMMAVARFAASLVTATVVGLIWSKYGVSPRSRHGWAADEPDVCAEHGGHDHDAAGRAPARERIASALAGAGQDVVYAGGYLVLGAMLAATVHVLLPATALHHLPTSGAAAVAALVFVAVIVSVCSEADAFVAASLINFSPVAQLAFMVVGPMSDVKLMSLQAGSYGWRFTVRLTAMTLLTGAVCAAVFGSVLL
jgi:uncharacterized membrane protein YraQ (UPF0718 family)